MHLSQSIIFETWGYLWIQLAAWRLECFLKALTSSQTTHDSSITVILQFLVSLILVQMEEHAVHRIQPTTHVLALLVSLVPTAVQTSTSVHLASVLMVVRVWRNMVRQLVVFALKDLPAQDVTLIFHSVTLTHASMVAHAMKDLEEWQLVTALLVSLVATAVQTSTSVHLASVLMVVYVWRNMVRQLVVFALKDLPAQDVTLIFHSVTLTHASMVGHAMKDLEEWQLVTALLVSLVATAVQTSTSVCLAPVLMMVYVWRNMVRQLVVFALKDLLAQHVTLIFHSVTLTHASMVGHVMKDLEEWQLVTVFLVSLVATAVQTSTSVRLAPVLMMVYVWRNMVRQLVVFALKDLLAQHVTLIFHSVTLTHASMVGHAMKDLEEWQLVTVFLVSLVATAVQTSTSVRLAPVLMMVHALKGMGQRLYARVPRSSVDLTAQCVLMVSCFK